VYWKADLTLVTEDKQLSFVVESRRMTRDHLKSKKQAGQLTGYNTW
jgi:hypothetical protein